MEPEASRAAIAAIAALQKRIKELEDEGMVLEDEKDHLKQQLDEKNTAFSMRENAYSEAQAKAKQFISLASANLIENRDMRTENQRLKHEIDETQKILKQHKTKLTTIRKKSKKSSMSLSSLMQRLAEYECLLGDLFAPPSPSSMTTDEIMFYSSAQVDPAILPPAISTIFITLQELPKEFTMQTLETKRKIVQALRVGKSTTTDLNSKIRVLEKQKFSSSKPQKFETEIKRLSAQLLIISNEMKKFVFV